MRASSAVEYAEVDKILTAASVPNDTQFSAEYALSVIKAPQGWDLAGLGAFPSTGGVKVGIIDTGIDRAHPEFAGRISNCAQSTALFGVNGEIRAGCDDDDGHGTKVAGILGANANNGLGSRASRSTRRSRSAARWRTASAGIDVERRQLPRLAALEGREGHLDELRGRQLHDSPERRHQGVEQRLRRGPARGRRQRRGYGTLYPAGYPEVISVTATDATDGWASANHNDDVEVAAPGDSILTTTMGGGYAYGSGTSAATPYAAGVAAVMRLKYPGANAAQIRNGLTWATDDLGEPGRDAYYGFGRVNLCKAMGGSC